MEEDTGFLQKKKGNSQKVFKHVNRQNQTQPLMQIEREELVLCAEGKSSSS